MFVSSPQRRLELPESLRNKLFAFRRRVWAIKLTEAACGAAFAVLGAYLVTFLLDRLWDTPSGLRLAVLLLAATACALIPLALYRWIWRQRRLEQLARLLSRTDPNTGDELLGIIELAASESEQARSLVLCEAAIEQVAESTQSRDFAQAVPTPRHIRRGGLALGASLLGLGVWALYPAAAGNAWARFLMAWSDIPRYTFAMVEKLPDHLVVAHGEAFSIKIRLTEDTVSRPAQAEARIGVQPAVTAQLVDGEYGLELPAQIDAGWLDLRVGDFRKRIRLEPTLRPELSSLLAEVDLPAYLDRTKPERKDVRGGAVTVVNGSRAKFTATATRELASARVDGAPIPPQGTKLVSPATTIQGNRRMELQWQDHFGLTGREPFVVTINGREDEAPSIACDGLPQRKVVLDSEQLDFKVTAQDDYGVKQVGMEWRGIDTTNFKNPAAGERILAAGSPDKELLELPGTFAATALGIEPQPIQLRLFVEDYLPGRPRVYSPTCLLYILTPEQHAIWLTEQLSKWHRQSLDVRDREMQLFEINKQLRQLSPEEINRAENRRRIENQAEAERANGRRLSNLVVSGEDLIKQAMRNPEFGVGHLEKWAEMLQILKDIAANRMPSVADLLRQAAQSPNLAQNSPSNKAPMAGQIRATGAGKSAAASKEQLAKKNNVPTVADVESSQQPPDAKQKEQPPKNSNGSPRLGLPVTMLAGGAGNEGDSCPAGQKMEEAVVKQQDLLAEFEKIADELNRVLANLEGSTLVKRLKAASRLQYRIAGRLGDQVNEAFGTPPTGLKDNERKLFEELSGQETQCCQDISNIMDDMQSYFERRRFAQFKAVLDDMVQQDAIGGLRQLGDDLQKENGLSAAQCEYWSDTFDRWAEDLVEPASGGT
jgi:hypothetical protein